MTESLNRKKGSNTPQYQVIRNNYFNLVLNFESVLPQFTAKCFEKKLISTNDKDASNNESQPLFDRSRALLDRILTKIQIDSESCVVLLDILRDFPELEHISDDLNESFLLSTVRNRKLSKTLHSLDPNRRYTHLGVLVKESSPYNSDSGDRIDHVRKYNVSEESSSSTLPRLQCEDSHDDYRVLTSTGPYLTSQEVSQDPIPIPDNIALQEESIKKKLLEQLEEQGERVSERDNIIKNLRKDCYQKDEIVRDFKKDIEEKEKIIENLKARCEEAEREQAKSEEKMERIQREHKNEIADLQKNIDELKQKEEDARFELEKAKRSLTEAELRKEMEMSELRNTYHKAELRKEMEMSELRNTYHEEEKLKLEGEVALKQKERELAEEKTKHTQEVANHEKKELEVALKQKEKELAEEKTKHTQEAANHEKKELEVALKQKEKELAEEKTKRAQEAADYEKKERLFAEERERVEKETVEKSHRHETEESKQRIRELEERQQQQHQQQQQHKCCTIL